MTRKTPSDFESHDDWLTHVRSEIPRPEQPYALAVGPHRYHPNTTQAVSVSSAEVVKIVVVPRGATP
jgi:hypothetical protein